MLVSTSKFCDKSPWLENRLVGKLKETIYEDDDIGVICINAIQECFKLVTILSVVKGAEEQGIPFRGILIWPNLESL